MYLSIDPGESSGWALWNEITGKLYACGAGDFTALRLFLSGHSYRIDGAVIELPQVYLKRLSKGDPNDLIKVAVQVGRYVESLDRLGCVAKLVHPHQWKGTITKDAHHAQIWAKCTPQEQEIIRRHGQGLNKKALGDMMDAVGLVQWAIRTGLWRAS